MERELAVGKVSQSRKRASLEIDLNKEFNVDLSGQRALKEAIGQAIVDRIVKRTKSGKSVQGGAFRGYSKAYRKSQVFQAAGKGGTPNLTLSGDMLGTMDFKLKGNKVRIGWDDAEENAKAANHNQGITLPKREFLGVQTKEIKDIEKDFVKDFKAALKKKSESRAAFEQAILGILEANADGS